MSKHRKPVMAICYDFDGTLSQGNMQEYDFIPQLGKKPKQFWKEANEMAKKQEADNIIAYMCKMLDDAKASDCVKFTRKAFVEYGRKIKLFPGVKKWFRQINVYAAKKGFHCEHYIISSGIKEMIEGNDIYKEFKRIYASSFMYDQNNVAIWPGMAINYTTKTQFLFRINKGALDIWDNEKINQYVTKKDRPIPFERMIYIGDGSTDVPCMKLVKEQGGHSIAVYKPNSKLKKQAEKLLDENRVHYVFPADYSIGKPLEKKVQSIIDKIVADYVLDK